MLQRDMRLTISLTLLLLVAFLQIPKCYSLPDTETLYPEGAGSYTEFPNQHPDSGFHWDKVDEAIPDEASTYIYSAIDDTGTYIDTFTVQDSSIEEGNTINSVTVYIRERSIPTTGNLRGYSGTEMISHSTLYEGAFAYASSTWSYKTTVYDVNPFTNEEWTLEEINAIEIGAKGRSRYDSRNGEWTSADITQCKIVIDYSPPVVGDWHSVETWYGNLITRQWSSVECWYGELNTRLWQSVEAWYGQVVTCSWKNVETWYGNFITKEWNVIENWYGELVTKGWHGILTWYGNVGDKAQAFFLTSMMLMLLVGSSVFLIVFFVLSRRRR